MTRRQRDPSAYEVKVEYDQEVLRSAFAEGLRPPSSQKVSEWANDNRFLSQKSAAEPGKWRTDRTPYLKDIMDALSEHSPYDTVVFMAGAQTGKTETGNNWLGYVIDIAPAPMMMVLPTAEMAKRSSRQRIKPLIEESPALKGKISITKGPESANNVLMKEFPGGVLVITGANSAIGLQSMPAKYLFCDEIDSYPGFASTADGQSEGDPLTMAQRRTSTYRGSSKMYLVSTPKRPKNHSRIEREYNRTDQRRYFVPCPHCQEMQTIEFDRLTWPQGQPELAKLTCIGCEGEIQEYHKTVMLAQGEWRPTAEGEKGSIGFHLSSLYSPVGWYSWGDAAKLYLRARDDRSLWKDFSQTVLGKPVVEAADTPEWDRVYERRESYRRGIVPARAVMLTAGVDIQRDRIEAEVVAWGRDLESWSVDYYVFAGDPAHEEVWASLRDLLRKSWDHELGGQLSLARMAVDSGFETQAVYAWVRNTGDPRVMAVKGYDRSGQPLGLPNRVDVDWKGKRSKRGVQIWPIGVSHFKVELFNWLRLPKPEGDEPAPRYCHFPQYDEEYFKRLCSEQRVTIAGRGGYDRVEWQMIHPRNEALDVRVYARAALMQIGADRWSDARWDELEIGVGLKEPPKPGPKTDDRLSMIRTENGATKPESEGIKLARQRFAAKRGRWF